MNARSVLVTSVAAAIASTAASFATGYWYAKRRLTAEYEERLDIELEESRAFLRSKARTFNSPGDAVDALVPPEIVEVLQKYQDTKVPTAYHSITKTQNGTPDEPTEETLVTSNVFEKSEEAEDEQILVISEDEFIENSFEYNDSTLTWYEGDGILTDEREDKVEAIEETVGTQFQSKFGELSSDENTVHVVNKRLGLLFEIVRSTGYYSVDVLGEEPPMITPGERIRRGG